ncbi:hypothetical protein N7475_005889 [Penicillium sp. IBT 31633x]|nr:hypothetical protein N7475_005889 [Penicillium sp. IBT 31633x]
MSDNIALQDEANQDSQPHISAVRDRANDRYGVVHAFERSDRRYSEQLPLIPRGTLSSPRCQLAE